ncbi:hypothetical protein SEA_SICARIUS2_43 [Arthrobacter phage Sicarius2]|uniref:Uncharacterized protein n=1 Tax=Arthrobacter phage Sicarius2 TaxID=2836090 RepID=A0A8F3E611_9CAUD|nr:hypothetical protein SEA_SICARIUS2_43 [Arthrobacter phage Sicarius2]
MTLKQYAAATDEIKQLASQLAASELKALRTAAHAARTRRLQELLTRAAEDARLGPQRLAAATAEARDYDRRQHEAKKAQHDHTRKQHTGETTEASPETRNGRTQTLAGTGQGDYSAEHPEAVRRASSAAA